MEWRHGPPAKKEPPEEYKPETDPYQPEYERKDSYKSTAGRRIFPVKPTFQEIFRQTDERRKFP